MITRLLGDIRLLHSCINRLLYVVVAIVTIGRNNNSD